MSGANCSETFPRYITQNQHLNTNQIMFGIPRDELLHPGQYKIAVAQIHLVPS